MSKRTAITFELNGRPVTVRVQPGRSLLHVLREDLDLTGTKQACDGEGECGACTILLDGQAVRSCLVPAERVSGRRVRTIEGLASPQGLHPLQQAFIEHGAVQCGFCTPGMIMSATALLDSESHPTRDQILEALEGNLCRCTGYTTIVDAVQTAAAWLRGEIPAPGPAREAERDRTGAPIVGGSQLRVDAIDKVTGAARYTEDIKMAGLLHAALVRSPHPHARLTQLAAAPALRLPGVVRVLTAGDIPGANSLEGYSRNEHLLTPVGETVRMVGDAIALVLAESPEAAQAGAAAVQVEYALLPHTYDATEAMSERGPRIYPDGNILNTFDIQFGDLQQALSHADRVLDSHYQTSFMEHSALERETALGYLDAGGRVTVIAGHQEPHWARDWTANLLALPTERVRVITPPIGGAFGGKQDPWPIMAAALAAYHAPEGRPVRLAYTRRESFDASPKRHPYDMNYRVGVRADGTLTALRLRIVANTGAYDADGYYIPQYGLVAGGGPYRWQAVDARAWSVYTNGPKAGQMRGFGTPQACFALECTLDEVAAALDLDPLEFRLQNAIDDESTTFLGYPPAETIGYRQCLAAIRSYYTSARHQAVVWNQDQRHSPWRRGVGLAGMWYRFGKSGSITSQAAAELGLDGQIKLFFAAPDYGQGTTTVMLQLAAEAL
ncbi:MAG: molybdopterin-dependent oxidoreductase, partial [Anaerolineae bacterium]